MSSKVKDSTRRDGSVDLDTFRKLSAIDELDGKPRPLTDRERLAKKQQSEGNNYRSLKDRSDKRTW